MDWTNIPGFGVAGNFTGHLEQAGESPDFVNVQTKEVHAPKGVFPFFLPGLLNKGILSSNPYSHDTIQLLNNTENHQIEPEVSIVFDVEYHNGRISSLSPVQALAHNDCSIRRHGATKISEKKNWGVNSKGVASKGIPLQSLTIGGTLDRFKLACFLRRNGELHTYGVTSWVREYSYFHDTLVEWLIDRFNSQKDHGPLEHLNEYLNDMELPNQICVSIGATRYTSFGENTFLKADDTIYVVLYDATIYTDDAIQEHLKKSNAHLPNTSVLIQRVVAQS